MEMLLKRTFRTGETVDAADVEEFKAQYLYEDGDFHNFMDLEHMSKLQWTVQNRLGEGLPY